MDTIRLIYAICVFLIGLGLAVSNIVLHYKEEKEYSSCVIFGSTIIIVFFCLACEKILFG